MCDRSLSSVQHSSDHAGHVVWFAVGPHCLHAGTGILASLQSDVAARMLLEVEKEWQDQVAVFVACGSSGSGCLSVSPAFEQCGSQVVNIAATSSCDKVHVQEHWSHVCGEIVNDEKHKSQSDWLASVMGARITVSSSRNLMSFNALDTFKKFFSRLEQDGKEQIKAYNAYLEKAAAEKAVADKAAVEKAEKGCRRKGWHREGGC